MQNVLSSLNFYSWCMHDCQKFILWSISMFSVIPRYNFRIIDNIINKNITNKKNNFVHNNSINTSIKK